MAGKTGTVISGNIGSAISQLWLATWVKAGTATLQLVTWMKAGTVILLGHTSQVKVKVGDFLIFSVYVLAKVYFLLSALINQ